MNTYRSPILRFLASIAAATLLALGATACSSESSENTQVIRLGLAPDEDAASVLKKFDPFVHYLKEKTGYDIEPYVGADYTAVIEAMNSGNLEVAWFGPSEYVLATDEVQNGVEAFASATQAAGTPEYRANFITLADSPINGPEDFSGRSIAYTDPASTSGHIFARYALEQEGINEPDLFSNVIYAGSHDAALMAVTQKQTDLAVVSSRKLPGMFESGVAKPEDIKVVLESEQIPADPVSFSSSLPEHVKETLRKAFLSDDPELRTALEGTGFEGFDVVNDSDYDVVRHAYDAAGLKPEL